MAHNAFITWIKILLTQNVIKRFGNGDKKLWSVTWRASEYVSGSGFGVSMRKGVHQATTLSRDIVLLLKPIVLQLMPKVASSTTSNTYAEDVDLKDFASKPQTRFPGRTR